MNGLPFKVNLGQAGIIVCTGVLRLIEKKLRGMDGLWIKPLQPLSVKIGQGLL